MTIAIALAVPDGIALAADTQTTFDKLITTVKEKGTDREVVLENPIRVQTGWARYARKIFPITLSKKQYAIAIAGASLINGKTPPAILQALEHKYKGDKDPDSVLKFVIEGIMEEFRREFQVQDLRLASAIKLLHFILAGFHGNDISRPFLVSASVYSGKPSDVTEEVANGYKEHFRLAADGRSGWSTIGDHQYAAHLMKHTNADLPRIVDFPVFTLGEAVDFVRFLAEFTCDYQRFADCVPYCGRPVVTAILTPDGFVEHPILGGPMK